MKIDFTKTDETIVEDLFNDLENAAKDPKHPFRLCVLATTEVDNIPTQRTLVFRGLLPSNEMLIFTDYRSPKLQEIKLQKQVSILFYHPEKKLQIRIQAIANIHHQDTTCLVEWNKLSKVNKQDYQTELPPGSDLPIGEEELTHNAEFGSDFFSIISLKPTKVDILQVSRMGHKRFVSRFENGMWNGRRVIP